jgi:hypothetical protein
VSDARFAQIDDRERSVRLLRSRPADIWVTNHASVGEIPQGRRKRYREEPGGRIHRPRGLSRLYRPGRGGTSRRAHALAAQYPLHVQQLWFASRYYRCLAPSSNLTDVCSRRRLVR